nr:MAG TPA: hypothetical protein [Caudoviricetes sp.]
MDFLSSRKFLKLFLHKKVKKMSFDFSNRRCGVFQKSKKFSK